MTFDQLGELIKSGYTQSQIEQIGKIFDIKQAADPAPSPDPAPTPSPSPAPSPEAPATPTPSAPPPPADKVTAATPAPDPAASDSETVTLLKQLLGIVQTNNINSMGMKREAENVDAAEILAEILTPTQKPNK